MVLHSVVTRSMWVRFLPSEPLVASVVKLEITSLYESEILGSSPSKGTSLVRMVVVS